MSTKRKIQEEVDVLEKEINLNEIVLFNDDVNTFDWVIKALVDICGHSEEQAEQCAILIHFKGKYAVKNGDYDTLKPMCNSITERGIGATIEETVGG